MGKRATVYVIIKLVAKEVALQKAIDGDFEKGLVSVPYSASGIRAGNIRNSF